MNKVFILLFSLTNAILYFILYYNLYNGPRSNDAGIVFIFLGLMLLFNVALLNVITLITSALKKDFKWTVIGFSTLAFVTFELLTIIFFKHPALFGLFGHEPVDLKNTAFIYSLCHVMSLLSVSAVFIVFDYAFHKLRAKH